MNQHVSTEASLEGEATPTLGADEGLLCVGTVHGLVGFQQQQLAEGFPAEFAAGKLLLLTLKVL